MQRPERRLLRLSVTLLALHLPQAFAQNAVVPADFPADELEELRDSLADSWYRTELLIFVREDDASRAAEQWEPLPELAYPDDARFLIDPELADRRLAESLAYQSRIDEMGMQSLMVPAPVRELLDHVRPDAITVAPPPEMLEELFPADEPNAPVTAEENPESPALATGTPAGPIGAPEELATAEDPNEPQPDLVSPVFALPYQTLADSELEFRAQARTLRRRGHRVLFHSAWWAPLDEAERTPSLLLDRAGDSDSLDWPALQGSVQIYRSRYLHIALDLWLNTLGEYLPEGWQIEPPPWPPQSMETLNMAGQPLDPWNPVEEPQPGEAGEPGRAASNGQPPLAQASGAQAAIEIFTAGVSTEEEGQVQTSGSPDEPTASSENKALVTAESDPRVEYPWSHAIVHRQSRRMRSGEIHYLDHPVIGVLVRVRAVDEDYLPLLSPGELEFRERHGLPVERLEMPSPDELDQ